MASLPFTTTLNPRFPQSEPHKPLKLKQNHPAKLHESDQSHYSVYKSYFHQISSLCKERQIQVAVNLLTEMEYENLQVGPEIYGELLQGCIYERNVYTGQQIHSRILKQGDFFARNEYIETKLVIFYAKCDVSDVTNHLFRRLKINNVFSWAAVIGLKCRIGSSEEALKGFVEMQKNGVSPDNFVLPNVLKACGSLGWTKFGKMVHGFVFKAGFNWCVFVASSLIDMYGKSGELGEARKVFDSMTEKNVISWNSMLVCYVQNGLSEEGIKVFYHMRVEGTEPSRVSISSLLSASANLDRVEEGKQGQAIAIINGLELDNFLGSSIINFYSKVGLIKDAERVFSKMGKKDIVIWNLLISSYVQYGMVDKGLDMCRLMRSERVRFDCVTLASILAAAADKRDIKLGKEGHCYCIRNNLISDVVVATSILDMYARCGKIVKAKKVFDFVTHRDIVMWNTLLAAYADFGLSGEALRLFYQMQLEGVPPNVASWNFVILGFLRSGQISEAKDMFVQMQSFDVQPNADTWTTLIGGLAQNGCGNEAIQFFKRMQEAGIKPNVFSITCVLSACTDVASLQNGTALHGFALRHGLYLLTPIASSLVDMYSRCGNINHLKRVFDMIQSKELPVYNAVISGYALIGQAVEAVQLYQCMLQAGIDPDNKTFTNVLNACRLGGMVKEGLELFISVVTERNIKPTVEDHGCLVNLLSQSGSMNEASRLALAMPFHQDANILGSLITACKSHNEIDLAHHLSQNLLELEPDNH